MFNFIRFAQELRIPYTTAGHHHCHDGWVQTHCPQCSDGRHGFHLGFSLDRGNANCWRCGPIRIVDAVRGLARVSPDRAWELVRKYGDGRKGGKRAPVARKRAVECPPELGDLLPQHLRYLERRGLDLSIVKEWGLRGTAHMSGRWSWRVVSPICNQSAEVVAYVGRAIHREAKPPYRMTEDEKCAEDPRGFVYGIQKVPGKTVIVVEGPADAWNMGPPACATLGMDWKPEQANRLRQFQNRFIMFDPEPKAQRRALELAQWLSQFSGNTEVISGLPSDPGSLSHQRVRRIRRTLLGREA